MEKFNNIIKNVLIFLVVFLAINYFMQSCQDNDKELLLNSGNFIFTTTKTEYSRTKIVTLNIENYTSETITIPSECPSEPFNVYRYEQNEWIQKISTPALNCENALDIEIAPEQKLQIPYSNWNNALFGEMGRFRIEFTTTLNGEEKTFQSNEFTVKKEGIFSQLWRGIFYRPIYNGLIFFTKVMPGHNLGLAIILLTIIIRTILLIPSHKAQKAQRRMQNIQPRLEEIKRKYKGDQQKIAMETMAIWKEAKVNPIGSCLPILLQLPFLIALFYAIKGGINPDNSHLLYTTYENFRLSDININFFNLLDLTKQNTLVLPLIVGGLQFAQLKLTTYKSNKGKKDQPKNEMAMATNMMTYFMPVMIAVFTASLPSGVGIYWGTSTLYAVVQQLFVNKSVDGGSKNNKNSDVKVKVIS
ncbi:YidC/Oxa1 family membrane protein insertase [Patescibacteria group bacterium]|nr:YidC/Oxa1 family membrane protein insertase [Patescibacteria group bacterium]